MVGGRTEWLVMAVMLATACGGQTATPSLALGDAAALEAGSRIGADSRASDVRPVDSTLTTTDAAVEVTADMKDEILIATDVCEDIHCLPEFCDGGACQPFICAAESVICGDEDHLKVCAVDGMSFALVPCFEGFCEAGECLPWICTPDEAMCDGNVATQCNPWGSALLDDSKDCEAEGGCCVEGLCQTNEPEICDGLDNDCDGLVDNGVLSPCGDCNLACKVASAGPGGAPFTDAGWQDYDVETDESGFLVSKSSKQMPLDLWIANSSANTVSRIDTESCQETGRYNICTNPSRTAVDLQGNVYIGCRNDGGVTKITGDIARCDKDGNGIVETATDTDGDGKVTGSEVYAKGEDECVEYITYPGGSCQRAVGVDRDNYAWVGEWNSKVLRRLHPKTGNVVQTINLPNNPYGLLVDMQGIIWISGRGGNKLIKVEPKSASVTTLAPDLGCFQPYGIGIDVVRRIWLANCCCENVVYMFDPVTETWTKIAVHSRPRGVAGLDDGRVVVGNDQSDEVAVIDGMKLEVTDYLQTGPNRFPIGVAPDANQYIWAANQNGHSATKFDLADNSVVCEVPVGISPYTYSDMTGYLLHKFTAPFLNPFHVQTFSTDSLPATWLFVKLTGTATWQCEGMELFVRFTEGEEWTEIATDFSIPSGQLDITVLPGTSPTLQAKIVIPYQNNGCELSIESIAAGYEE
jgi:DNA-binding beta-propeller fold protein YncE